MSIVLSNVSVQRRAACGASTATEGWASCECLRAKPYSSARISLHYLVVAHLSVVLDHDFSHFLGHHGDVNVSTSKPLNCFDGMPACHDQELNAFLQVTSQD